MNMPVSASEMITEVNRAIERKHAELDGRMLEIEQRSAVNGGYGEPEVKSWGEQFVANDALKAFAHDKESRPQRLRMEVKAITSLGTSGGPVAGPAYRDDVVNIPQRPMRVRGLLPTVRITSGSFEYAKQTTRTNNAAMVAEGDTKPESAYAWTMLSGTPKVIAHWVPASVQILDDAAQLAGLIDTELRYGLALKEDQQLLYGSGGNDNLLGLVTAATAYAAPAGMTAVNMMDQVALAILQATLADYTPGGIVMHPADWMRIRLLKDGDGKYLLGDPGANVPPVLFGLPVVPTVGMTVDKFLVGDFEAAATLYDRWEPRVEVSTEHADFFTRNLVAVRAEQRLGLAVKQAGALIYGDFGNVT